MGRACEPGGAAAPPSRWCPSPRPAPPVSPPPLPQAYVAAAERHPRDADILLGLYKSYVRCGTEAAWADLQWWLLAAGQAR
jgi:hypothetical protein